MRANRTVGGVIIGIVLSGVVAAIAIVLPSILAKHAFYLSHKQ
jgi:hypothetical protein